MRHILLLREADLETKQVSDLEDPILSASAIRLLACYTIYDHPGVHAYAQSVLQLGLQTSLRHKDAAPLVRIYATNLLIGVAVTVPTLLKTYSASITALASSPASFNLLDSDAWPSALVLLRKNFLDQTASSLLALLTDSLSTDPRLLLVLDDVSSTLSLDSR